MLLVEKLAATRLAKAKMLHFNTKAFSMLQIHVTSLV
jgi:hypothetical protein